MDLQFGSQMEFLHHLRVSCIKLKSHRGVALWRGIPDRMCVPLVVVSSSPHLVKPLTTATLAEEKRTEGRSVLATGLEKLKSTIHPGRSSQLSEQETDRKKVQKVL